MRFVVQTAMPVPKKSVSSVQIPHANPIAVASTGQSSSSAPHQALTCFLLKGSIPLSIDRLNKLPQVIERCSHVNIRLYAADWGPDEVEKRGKLLSDLAYDKIWKL